MPSYTRYGRARPTQRRWGRRVRKQARKEIMTLAESKRQIVFQEAYSFTSNIVAGDVGTVTYISNVFGAITTGTGPVHQIGSEIIAPLAVLRLAIEIDWNQVWAAFSSQFRDIFVDVALIASEEQFPSTIAARATSADEESRLYMKHPIMTGRSLGMMTFNGDSVTVIKKKKLLIQPPSDTASRRSTRHVKMVKRFRGKKQFDTTFDASGSIVQTRYLKGWNYYWVVTSAFNQTPTTGAQATSAIKIFGDRYLYFKDF